MCRRETLQFGAFLFAVALNSFAQNAAAIKDFGSQKGKPIDKGFVFWNYQYIEAPYVVDRRGLDIYINGMCVMPGPMWPHDQYIVKDDPGDLPAGCTLWNDPGRYLGKKWGYLSGKYDEGQARRMMVEVYKRCPDVKEAVLKDEDVRITEQNGQEHTRHLGTSTLRLPGKDQLLEGATGEAKLYENTLKGNGLVWRGDGIPQVYLATDKTRQLLELILSKASVEDKVKHAEGLQLVIIPEVRKLVSECVPSAQLRKRFEALEGGNSEEEEDDRPDWIAQAQEKSRQIAQQAEEAETTAGAPADGLLLSATPTKNPRIYLWLSVGSALLGLLFFILGWRFRSR